MTKKMLGWNLNGDVAELSDETGNLLSINLAQPSGGLRNLRSGLLPLQVVAPKSIDAMLSDRFIRGHDLIADYATGPKLPYQVRLYWSAPESEDGQLIDFSVVVRTSAWVCEPEVEIATSFLDAEVLIAAQCGEPSHRTSITWHSPQTEEETSKSVAGLLVYRQRSGICLIEMFASTDLQSISAEEGTMRYRLLSGELLEKGVIRRTRMRTIIAPTASQLDQAQSAWRRFQRGSLPLTP